MSHKYCQVFMSPWLIITGFVLDDWIYYHVLSQSLLITMNYNSSQSIFSRTLLPWLSRARPFSFTFSLWFENTSVAQQWIYANHKENTSSSTVLLTERCIAMEVIRLLSGYSLMRECVYRVVAQQWVYIKHYTGSEVLTPVIMKRAVLWVITPCSLFENQPTFRRNYPPF
jgi:hypothetical protein